MEQAQQYAQKAIEIAKAGNFDAAFEMAQKDEFMNPNTTKAQWVGFAQKAIARREAEANQQLHWD